MQTEELLQISSPAQIAFLVIIIKEIITRIVDNISDMAINIILAILSCGFSVLSLYIYYEGFNNLNSIVAFVSLWALSLGSSLGIETQRNRTVLNNRIKELESK